MSVGAKGIGDQETNSTRMKTNKLRKIGLERWKETWPPMMSLNSSMSPDCPLPEFSLHKRKQINRKLICLHFFVHEFLCYLLPEAFLAGRVGLPDS